MILIDDDRVAFSSGNSGGRESQCARGRGRGRTLPAWMTKDIGDGERIGKSESGNEPSVARARSSSPVETNAEPVFDEFGRWVPPPTLTSLPSEWPPEFETNGSAFVFDARSAMFYHGETEFFYDAKLKLYYGNKQGAYFDHQRGRDPPFVKVQRAASRLDQGSMHPSLFLATKSSERKEPAKMTISIKIKSKKLGSGKPKKDKAVAAESSKLPPTPALPVVKKSHAADMEKWSQRSTEKNAAAETTKTSAKPEHVAKTKKGEAICLLCKRKFPTIAKLQYHFEKSSLHQENVAKHSFMEAAYSSYPQPESEPYLDRAQQRRAMHGTDAVVSLAPPLLPPTGWRPRTTTVQSSDNLGQTNIGNQMLQRLGWKSGDSLGKHGGDPDQIQGAQHDMTKEWDKIESIAKSGGVRQKKNAGPNRYRK